MKSFRPRDGDDDGGAGGGRNPEADFRGQRRRNDTHASITDSDARLFRKGNGQESRLVYLGHLLSENRHGLVVRATTTRAGGRAEWEAGLAMVGDLDGRHRITVGGDKGYDVKDSASGLRALGARPHVARTTASPRRAGGAGPRSTAGPPGIRATFSASAGAS